MPVRRCKEKSLIFHRKIAIKQEDQGFHRASRNGMEQPCGLAEAFPVVAAS